MNGGLIFDLATCGFIAKCHDALFLGPGWDRQESSGAGHRSSRYIRKCLVRAAIS
jgi:hypothetical protein